MKLSTRVCAGFSSLTALAVLFVAAPAAAQDEVPPPAAGPVAAGAAAPEPKVPGVSIALERVGGIAYGKASSSEGNGEDSVSVTAFGIGGVTPNPFAIPRLGVDFILPSNLTLGGAVGFSRVSGSVSSSNSSGSSTRSEDIGSVFLYTLTPRIGYRIPLSSHVDFTPRAGLTLAGASASPANSNDGSASIFALAIGADAPFAFRLTDSFNLLAGAALDYTVSATVTTESRSSTIVTGPGGTTTSTSNAVRSEDVKGSLFSMQAWLGLGGYL